MGSLSSLETNLSSIFIDGSKKGRLNPPSGVGRTLPQARACCGYTCFSRRGCQAEVGELRPGEMKQLSQVPAPPAAVGPATHRTGLTCQGPLAGCTCLLGPHWAFLSPSRRAQGTSLSSRILLPCRAHGPRFTSPLKSEADPQQPSWLCSKDVHMSAVTPTSLYLTRATFISLEQASTAILFTGGGKLVQTTCLPCGTKIPFQKTLSLDRCCARRWGDAQGEAFKFRSVTLSPNLFK